LTFIDNSNIITFKQFHEKSINSKIYGRELVTSAGLRVAQDVHYFGLTEDFVANKFEKSTSSFMYRITKLRDSLLQIKKRLKKVIQKTSCEK